MKTSNPTSEHYCERLHELFLRHHAFVRQVCLRYVQNPEEADDLAQEALLKAARGWDRFTGECRPATWLYRVAANHCIDYLRRRRRQVALALAYTEDLDLVREEFDGGAEDFTCPAREVREALEEDLDPVDRHVLYLRFDLGLTQEGIGEVWGVSRTMAGKRLARIERKAPLPSGVGAVTW